MMMLAPPAVEEHAGLAVVRDDRTPGGTKARFLPVLYERWPEADFVYGGPAEGYAQVAMGYAAAQTGKRSWYFVAKRKQLHARSLEARMAGCRIIEVGHGRLNVVHARAREFAARRGARLLPLGIDCPEAVALVADVGRALGLAPAEVWCAAGTGVLTRGLQQAWPGAEHHAVQVGRDPQVGAARLWKAPERFAQAAELPPPFPSCSNYDAKVWRFAQAHARPGALVWNVAA